MDKYSEKFMALGQGQYETLVRKIDSLAGVFYHREYNLVRISDDRIGICGKIKTGAGTSSPLRSCEPVMIVVDPNHIETVPPEVFPDRFDFDFLAFPHINPGEEHHRSLCLTREPFTEWYSEHTFEEMLHLIPEWFMDAANGKLIKYKEGDGFEPVYPNIGTNDVLFIWGNLEAIIKRNGYEKLLILPCSQVENSDVVHCGNITGQEEVIAAIFYNKNVEKIWNGYYPNTVNELKNSLDKVNFANKKNQLSAFLKKNSNVKKVYVIHAIKRPSNIISKNSSIDYKGVLMMSDDWKNNQQAPINQVFFYEFNSQKQAARISGTNKNVLKKRILLLGCGAIGCKLAELLYKSGISNLTICDNDIFLAHNVYRHNLTRSSIKKNKAQCEVEYLNSIYLSQVKFVEDDAIKYIEENGIGNFDVVIDATASARVFRYIDDHLKRFEKCLVIRYVLSDKGNTGIVYGWQKSDIKLSDYYQYLLYSIINGEASNIDLSEWVQNEQTYNLDHVRIGEGCHSETMILGDDIITAHTGLASLRIKQMLLNLPNNEIYMSKIETKDMVSCVTQKFQVRQFVSCPCHDHREWEVRIIEPVWKKMIQETLGVKNIEHGGYLLGSVDVKHYVIYVLDTFVPLDNQGTNANFCLGVNGWKEHRENVRLNTGNQVYYVGDWHSHPKGGVEWSTKDKTMFDQLRQCNDMPPYFLGIITNGHLKRAYLLSKKN